MTEKRILELQEQWNNACLSLGIPAITLDTCARIMAVVYYYGNNEEMVFNKKFLNDVEYIRKRFQIYGTGTPPTEFADRLRKYVAECEEYEESHKDDKMEDGVVFRSHAPEWAVVLFREKYNIKIIN